MDRMRICDFVKEDLRFSQILFSFVDDFCKFELNGSNVRNISCCVVD
jgi:hypothetical protein